jgi:hypothetical protein
LPSGPSNLGIYALLESMLSKPYILDGSVEETNPNFYLSKAEKFAQRNENSSRPRAILKSSS